MSLFRRFSQVFQQKANAALDKVEDPSQALDLSYQKLLEQYNQVRRAVADVLTSQKRLEAQRSTLLAQYEKLQGQARQALSQGQEDLARTALARADVVQRQVDGLAPQIDQLKTQESQLELAAQKLQAKVESFRAQRDTLKAQYSAAKASTQAIEGVSGISEQMADVSLMLDRAQNKIDDMKARSAAVGELADAGVLDSLEIGPGAGDDIDAQLRKGTGDPVEAQLQAMKAQMAIASPPGPAGSLEQGKGDAGQSPQAQDQAPNRTSETMIVRIAGQGQYSVASSIRPALDGLDDAMSAALSSSDADSFASCVAELEKLIKNNGTKLSDEENRQSDLIVPSTEMSLEEARLMLRDAPGES